MPGPSTTSLPGPRLRIASYAVFVTTRLSRTRRWSPNVVSKPTDVFPSRKCASFMNFAKAAIGQRFVSSEASATTPVPNVAFE